LLIPGIITEDSKKLTFFYTKGKNRFRSSVFLYVVNGADYANMTNAFRVSARNMQPQWSAVNQDIPSNSVIVRNLSPSTREETIIIHFQKKRNGGGEVEGVRLFGEGVAVVTFEKLEGW